MKPHIHAYNIFIAIILLFGILLGCRQQPVSSSLTLLNVSYDPTRELYKDYNQNFAAYYKAKTGNTVTVQASHGGSGKQARAVIDGLDADVVTLALAYDIDAMAKKAMLLPIDWQNRLPNNSTPFTSTIIFLVRQGNPKGIHDWDDLIKPGISVITPNPKTSGGARWNYLAAWGDALKKNGGDEAKARAFVTALYKNVPILDAGARGSTITFAQRGIGDVLIAWESEAYLARDELGKDKFTIITPPTSIVAEPPVTLVDKIVDKKKTRTVAQAYLEYLYSPQGQEIAAKHYYRPRLDVVAQKYAAMFPKINQFTLAELFGSWQEVQKKHFDDGGIFDQIYMGAR